MPSTTATSTETYPGPWRTSLLAACLVLLAACGSGGGGSSRSDDVPLTPNSGTNQTSTTGTAAAPVTPPEEEPALTRIKVLALVSAGVAEQFDQPDLRIDHLFHTANAVLADNAVDLAFDVVHMELVDYPDSHNVASALDDVTFAAHPSFAGVHQLRDEVAADLVTLFRPYANDGRCGYAWVGGYQTEGDFSHPSQADYGYAVVAANCDDYTLLHELGHNLGLAHSRREDPEGGTYAYAVGHGQEGAFVTIMASPTEFSAPKLPRLSSPEAMCQGAPCGVPHSDPADGADAVRALSLAKDQVAAYR